MDRRHRTEIQRRRFGLRERQPAEVSNFRMLLSFIILVISASICTAQSSEHRIQERDLTHRAISQQESAHLAPLLQRQNHQHEHRNGSPIAMSKSNKMHPGGLHVINQHQQTTSLNTRKFTILGSSSQFSPSTRSHNNTFLYSPRHHLQSQVSSSPQSSLGTRAKQATQEPQQAIRQQHEPSNNLSQRAGLFEKICIGTSNKLAFSQLNKSDHYQNLYERYKDCTYVIGNLEITWLDKTSGGSNQELDLSFLESIREITGYLLIAHVNVAKISLPNLEIIRGRDLFKAQAINEKEEFALVLIENELESLELPNLAEIQAGSFGSYDNPNLCRIRTIDWEEILGRNYKSIFVYNGAQPECKPCDPNCRNHCWGEGPEMCQKFSKSTCAQACGGGRCFGPTSSDCCHQFCAGGCTGPNQTDCLACKNFYDDGSCVQECPSMMWYNPSKFLWEPNPLGKYAFGATCVRECPENMLRDSGACVRLCPPNKRSINGECVPCGGPCPKNCQGVEVVHSDNIDQLINCTVIEGSITILDESFTGEETSPSPGHLQQPQQQSQSAGNQSSTILTTTAIASPIGSPLRHKPMHPSRLEVFKTLREITGFLNIRAKHRDFRDLSYFTNLRTIHGHQTTDMRQALSITRSSLVSLNLRSLKRIMGGKITIEENPELCFADTIDWLQIETSRREDVTIRNNAESSKCRSMGLQCHGQCARDGCWGPGPDNCLSCSDYKLDDYCVVNCSSTKSLLGFLSYEESSVARICKRCHPECREGCNGTEARHCHACRSVKDGPYCVPECPSHKYNKNGTCQECDKGCGPDGCTGPLNKLGEGGCNSCAKAIIRAYHDTTSPVGRQSKVVMENVVASGVNVNESLYNSPEFDIECIRAEESCPDGYYQEYVVATSQPEGSPLKSSWGRPICRKCHHRCKRCIGMGTHKTVCECAKFVAGEQCEEECPHDYFVDKNSRQCVKCSPECNGCFGPTESDCSSCYRYRIYYESTAAVDSATNPLAAPSVSQQHDQLDAAQFSFQTSSSSGQRLRFNCSATCPPDKPHRMSEGNMLEPYCSDNPGIDDANPSIVSLSSTSILCMFIISAALMVCVSIYRYQIERDKTYKMTMRLSGLEDVEPLTPSNLKPNLAPLRSIKESELSEGKVLGSGFGGTVHQGFWKPEGKEYKHSIPVAIKKLRDNGQSNLNKEFLEEAYIMASVDHPNLVRLLAVCMTPKNLMLVTQLIPLGCLLDYVKKNKPLIGSKDLLEWGKQIARGMAYLEERRLVHRDLALRNVLLQTPRKALISDFGLAKFLELDQSEYHSGGGRLPIKWLAPECISERKFTHKSDVWAFGVTIWELVTFGQRPFEEYETRDVPLAIIKGARLQHPDHVSTELRTVMLACWAFKPEGRPSFKQLVQSFVKFARDPERYLVCNSKETERRQHSPITDDENERDNDEFQYELEDDENDDCDGCEEMPSEEVSPISLSSSQPPLGAAMPNLTPSTHNRLNEMFGFELQRHRASESSDLNGQSSNLTTPILKRIQMFGSGSRQLNHLHNHHHHHHHQSQQQPRLSSSNLKGSNLMTTDSNNNTAFMAGSNNEGNDNNNRWSMHHTISSTSLGQKSEQPTDMYDYLLPSPSTNEHGHMFSTFYVNSYDQSDTLPMTNPPHSAGVVSNITNEEYFLTRANYANNSHQNRSLSTSNGNIPQSLV